MNYSISNKPWHAQFKKKKKSLAIYYFSDEWQILPHHGLLPH
jgi:hypothetical protein